MIRNTGNVKCGPINDYAFRDLCDQPSLKYRIDESREKVDQLSFKVEKIKGCKGGLGDELEKRIRGLNEEVIEIIDSHYEEQRCQQEQKKEELKRHLRQKLENFDRGEKEHPVEPDNLRLIKQDMERI